MTKEVIEERVKDIICDYVDVNRDDIDSNMSFSGDIGIDSFGLISMICSVEDSFNIRIPESELVNFQTLSDMVDYIKTAVA